MISKKRVEVQTNNNLIKGNKMQVKEFERKQSLFWLRVVWDEVEEHRECKADVACGVEVKAALEMGC